MAVTGFSVAIAILALITAAGSATFTIAFDIFVFFLQTFEDLVECSFSCFVAVQCIILVRLLHARLNIVPRVAQTYRRLEMLDSRAKCIDGTALLAISSMLVIFATFENLLSKTLEDEL